MRTRFIACAALVASAVLPAAASAAGPAPPLVIGEPGIPVAGGAHVVTIAGPSATSTRVWLVRDRDGTTIRQRVVSGKLGVPGVTFNGVAEGTWANGRRLVLSSSVYDDQSRTRFVVIDTHTLRALQTITLRGAFAFDALSPDGRRLYLLQFPQGVNGGVHYVVRSLNMRTGRLEPGAIVDRTEPDEQMNGIAMHRAWSPDRTWAYTLYNGGSSHAFIHALNTRNRSARCIDLPWKGEGQSILEHAQLTVTPGALTLLGPDGQPLASVDPKTFAVTLA
jgi:hypothetical protein